jgi:hypothetical protein
MNYLIEITILYIEINDIYQRIGYGGIVCQDYAIKSCSRSL